MKCKMDSGWISKSDNAQAFLTIIQQIPKGKVATYGQIAKLAGLPRNSRQVGTVLKALPPKSDVPWHRVVNSHGKISSRGTGDSEMSQRARLTSEGIKFDSLDRIPLNTYRWNPEG